ncbi:hypothetical protein P168DRAFT_243245 [Aspergillus campestris IBT 28561]|uniref:FAD binding domain protein n=1 Tax=Aspergillus campestris (strain IBT 28561) TaxID=1392248 RepID=A0A2I1CSS8_ASPC2|nr:uncharacterized protein P168DRAFT_243245 [Aspergillus campestris IBT 28561]PKY00671.1 hypothetical protein P168DRAFT_243245 [Aspergillus campestris IBT 28561]
MTVHTGYTVKQERAQGKHLLSPPLPRLTQSFEQNGEAKYEVIVVGGGPAGMMLTLLLARYGLDETSLLCIDNNESGQSSGHADAFQPRTLEVLKSLGLADDIINAGYQLWETAVWDPSPTQKNVIEHTAVNPLISTAARYPFNLALHLSKIEPFIENDLLRYHKQGIQRGARLSDVKISDDPGFPVEAIIEDKGQRRTVRSKYLVGADGAHSSVRRCMELQLEGDSLGYIWGVIDLIVETDFPDIRRPSFIHSSTGSVLVIPREQVESGEYLTRLYVQTPEKVNTWDTQETTKAKRNGFTLENILQYAAAAFRPFKISPKPHGGVYWWAVYEISQRMLSHFTVADSAGTPRVFFVGDACHVHSPMAGQGMNVSMMDSYNLAWKLMYSINGLTPKASSKSLLDSYHTERYPIAKQLMQFDRVTALMASGKVTAARDSNGNTLTSEDFIDNFKEGSAFMSGCGIEYQESIAVQITADNNNPISGTDYASGILRPGRRLLNVKLRREADGSPRDLHDSFQSSGRFRILVLASSDLLDPQGTSSQTLKYLTESLLPSYAPSTIEMVAVHPGLPSRLNLNALPSRVKQYCEMSFYDGSKIDDAYQIFGVDNKRGVLAVVRPDGYVGVVAELGDVGRIDDYLQKCVQRLPLLGVMV